MLLTSSAFGYNESIPEKYTCDGENIGPPLHVQEVPEGVKSLALVIDDPDSKAGSWVHWTVWNIPPDTVEIKSGSLPDGAVEGLTSFGESGYGGPCPSSGTHRYFFKLYALDTILDISADTDINVLGSAMNGHILDKAGIVGLYSKK